MTTNASIPSIERPTREFLHANYKKEDLQKHCRDLGFSRVWVNKDKLIDMILENHRISERPVPESIVQSEESTELHEKDVLEVLEELREREKISKIKKFMN